MKDSFISKKVNKKDVRIRIVTCECPFGYCGETLKSTAFEVESVENGKSNVEIITLNSFNTRFNTNLNRSDIDKLYIHYPELNFDLTTNSKTKKPCVICKFNQKEQSNYQSYKTVNEAVTQVLENINKKISKSF